MIASYPPFLRVRDIRKEFPGVLALDGVSLDVHAGEIIGLVGKNGAGKSTLMKVLAGVVEPDAGAIEIDDEPAQLATPHDATRARLAFVHQELAFAPNLSVAENVLLGLGYPSHGPLVRWGELRRRVRTILDRLEADIPPDAPMSRLGPAQQRLVMIAHALAQNARLLVLDEPSAALTDDEIEHLHAVVRRLAHDQVAVIYISHRLEEILGVSDRVVVMRDAKVVGEQAASELTADSLIQRITGGATEIVRTRAERSRPRPRYDGVPVLRMEQIDLPGKLLDISFAVHPGEILGLAGLVGSGRTELVRAVFGADQGHGGQAFLHGEPVRIDSPGDAVQAGIALLPEDRRRDGNVLDFSVRRNLTLVTLTNHRVAGWLGIPSRASESRAAASMMKDLGIRASSADAPVRWLSGGNQQKVMLGKWMALGSSLYIFDEPTQGIDVEAKEEAFRLMDALAAEGKGVILISSDFSELVAMCDRVLTLREGRVVAERRGAEITEVALVESCYAA